MNIFFQFLESIKSQIVFCDIYLTIHKITINYFIYTPKQTVRQETNHNMSSFIISSTSKRSVLHPENVKYVRIPAKNGEFP